MLWMISKSLDLAEYFGVVICVVGQKTLELTAVGFEDPSRISNPAFENHQPTILRNRMRLLGILMLLRSLHRCYSKHTQ